MDSGTQTQGAVILSQCRMVDLVERSAKRIETAPIYIIQEALGELQAAIDLEE
ncbi:hypothetical protein [Glaciimonas immobilis]|uniref:mRNA-degrading endonuclease toxin of MazEF toxin-antitoxin module n=2 Tax=Glaciimonas immobilis TaxID=728004 RepID=A0A840RTL2_9BURK|nr:hypothetical protein [Glaciimonas immobilis]MBB5200378.1 mRNA-degrading endonuclease toxin of MazEF toxin-antitoxin module [Glaciimonas immobilis]